MGTHGAKGQGFGQGDPWGQFVKLSGYWNGFKSIIINCISKELKVRWKDYSFVQSQWLLSGDRRCYLKIGTFWVLTFIPTYLVNGKWRKVLYSQVWGKTEKIYLGTLFIIFRIYQTQKNNLWEVLWGNLKKTTSSKWNRLSQWMKHFHLWVHQEWRTTKRRIVIKMPIIFANLNSLFDFSLFSKLIFIN